MKFSIVIPLYNEAENIIQLNNELLSALKESNNNDNEFEIIYVNDGSTDKTLDYLKELNNEIKTIVIENNYNLAQSKSILNGLYSSIGLGLIYKETTVPSNGYSKSFNLPETSEIVKFNVGIKESHSNAIETIASC